jgi:RNA polymerase sigma-70 factor (ECF subfamily)
MSDDHIPGQGSLTQESAPDVASDAALEAARISERLVAAILSGHRAAEDEFALRYMRPVKAMLMARSRNPDLAADLVQDVMIEAICALRRGQLREPAKLSSFVIAIARNLLNSHFRGEARRPESLELPDNLPDLSRGEDRMEEQQREMLVMVAMASLDPLDKSILQMTLVDGLKPGVIAERLRLAPDVVRQRKLRATRRVIDLVRGQSQTAPPIHLNTGHMITGQRK